MGKENISGKPMQGLTPKQWNAINNRMKGMSMQEAMLEAGYGYWYAMSKYMEFFSIPKIEKEIRRRQSLSAKRADVDMDWIVERLKDIANADLGEALDIHSDGSASLNFKKLTPQLKRALQGFTVDEYSEGRGKNAAKVKKTRISLADKLRALELLIRHLGLSKEKTVIEGEIDLVDRLQKGRRRLEGDKKEEEEDA